MKKKKGGGGSLGFSLSFPAYRAGTVAFGEMSNLGVTPRDVLSIETTAATVAAAALARSSRRRRAGTRVRPAAAAARYAAEVAYGCSVEMNRRRPLLWRRARGNSQARIFGGVVSGPVATNRLPRDTRNRRNPGSSPRGASGASGPAHFLIAAPRWSPPRHALPRGPLVGAFLCVHCSSGTRLGSGMAR